MNKEEAIDKMADEITRMIFEGKTRAEIREKISESMKVLDSYKAKPSRGKIVSVYEEEMRSFSEKTVALHEKITKVAIAIEEMAELTQALVKDTRGQGDYDNIVEEIADVTLMLDQLKVIFGIPDEELNDIIRYKINRQMRRDGEVLEEVENYANWQ